MLDNLRISGKLALLGAGLFTAMAAIGGYGIHALSDARMRHAASLQDARQLVHATDAARSAEVNFRMQVQEFKNILLRGQDPKDYQRHLDGFKARNDAVGRQFAEASAEMGKLGVPAGPLQEAQALHREVTRQYLDALQLYEAGKPESAQRADAAVRGKDRPLEQRFAAVIGGLEKHAQESHAGTLAAAEADARAATLMLAALVAAMLAAGLVAGWRVTRGITRPLGDAVGIAQRVAGGDLTMEIDTRRRDEIGELMRALAQMNEGLRAIVGEVSGGARTVADTSSQIAQGNIDLSQRTEEQAGTLEETASSLEELTSTVSQNAENARQASQLAVTASDVARKGGAAVNQVVSTMDGIAASSRRISDITAVIDGIAFQTNILALNAAVEAARAGDQGRGFAVVAGEVRTLAQRSAAAAKEIKALITESVGQVEAGTHMVGNAGQTMAEIVASVKKVSDLIAEIAAASQEQSAGLEQVNTAMSQMDHVVQQNASLVEEAAAATEAMKAQASTLLDVVARFRLRSQALQAVQAVAVQPARAEVRPPPALAGAPKLRARPALAAARAPQPPRAQGWEEF
jgi:methyl-accepting chemotaxis protein